MVGNGDAGPLTVGEAGGCGTLVGTGGPLPARDAAPSFSSVPANCLAVTASGLTALSSALPVASGLFAGAGRFADAAPVASAAGLGPTSAPAVGELDGVLSAGVVAAVVGVVGVPVSVCDGLPVSGGVVVEDELLDGVVLGGGELGAVGEQLGVAGPVDPPLLPWPDGPVLPPVLE